MSQLFSGKDTYKRFRHFRMDKVKMDFAFFAIAFNLKKMWMLRSMTTQFWGLWNGRIFRSKTTQNGDFTTKTALGHRPIPEHCHPFRSITTQF